MRNRLAGAPCAPTLRVQAGRDTFAHMLSVQARLLPLLIVSVTACSMPPGMNDDCNAPEQLFARDRHARVDRDHLIADVKVIEELAMRHADSQGKAAPGSRRRQLACEAKLFDAVAQSHGVTLSAMADARQQLDRPKWDSAVHLPLVAFYLTAATLFATRVRRRFPDEKLAAVVITLVGSLVAGGVFLVVGHLWHGMVEMIRLGTTHMSYRVARLGWGEYGEEVFALAVLLFWCAVGASYRAKDPPDVSEDRMSVFSK